ncbi:hypothetical protein HG536_0B04470 [Torulaspora globosa]|uniref:Uncharacterized protein n=1 Tax=Torulaspora globosa TaxID=48254 RepID=A0A7G3ZDJ7_9SACH|nr:uncharacterized protein HG536_0B04470 [Torulaspora globosa]QLL31583.1 hypothetical protein HG536_0B04470 [Torulaspora globosa]
MDLVFLSPSSYRICHTEDSHFAKDDGCLLTPTSRVVQFKSAANNGFTVSRRNRKRKRRLLGRRPKKTHLWCFNIRQRKSKRPRPVPSVFLSGANLVRFGAFCGIRDSRATRCSLRGIRHGLFIRAGTRCACASYTLYPSPLVCLTQPIVTES